MLNLITPSVHIDFPRVFRTFEAHGLKDARLTVTGLGLYRAFLNGQRIGEDYLTPGFNDYDAYVAARTYDVTPLLREGENLLEIWLGKGWYGGRLGYDPRTSAPVWGTHYYAGARLTAQAADGSGFVLETDESWLASATPIREGNIYDGEIRDDTADCSAVFPCRAAVTAYRTEPDQAPPVRAIASFQPAVLHTPKGETVLDFGQNISGFVRFADRLQRGQTMRLQYGEVLQDGCFHRDNLRSARAEYVYTSDGAGKTVEPYFTFYGFRYVKVEGAGSEDPADYTAVAVSSDLPVTMRCATASEKVNRLIRNTLWGQRDNFVSIPTDCPQRDERLGWTADTQVFCRTAMYQMDCREFYRKFIRDMREDQVRYLDGDVPKYSPSLRGLAGHGGAVWADAGVIIPWEVYQTYGDRERLAEAYPLMHDYTEYLIREDRRLGGTHILFDSFTFGDWLALDGKNELDVHGGTDTAYIQGVYYMNAVRLTAKAAAVLGLGEDARRYTLLEEGIRHALLDEYFTPGGNLSADTQTGYVLALYYGLWRDKEKLLRGFRRRLDRDGGKLKTGFAGTPLLLPVLLDNGMTETAYKLLLNEEYPGWLYAVNLGATTVWERWNSILPDGRISDTGMNSLNHYANGSVCEAIYSRMAGLRCAEPGWKKAVIAPKASRQLPWIDLKYESPAGLYAVKWTLDEAGVFRMDAEIPEGCLAQVILPGGGDEGLFGPGRHAFEESFA